ncbi:lamina-associated polypeptide 2, isoforms alpha/zeta-like [Bufo gargarizans]|uniref:lamina-associated polypeptide 2, isoforms alpha/zeta-like n=1 Tax=Bufo gargarizans TaxID=30331 RepID=UPI001CF22ACB|nr:lamina-associated polypeptide 2, isoforms alpha/zeta-like [Bufo gargarizans]
MLDPGEIMENTQGSVLSEKESAQKAKSSQRAKKCSLCSIKLSDSSDRKVCKKCTDNISKDLVPSLKEELKNTIREEIRAAMSDTSLIPSCSKQAQGPATKASDSEFGELGSEDSGSDSEFKNYLFSSEDTRELTKAVRATMDLSDEKICRSVHDEMFSGFEQRSNRGFPVHKNMHDLIKREWRSPDRKLFIPRTIRRRLPFSSEDEALLTTCPKIDVSLSKLVKGPNALPFEDMGSLRDPMDKKTDQTLKKTWEACAALFKPNLAATSVSRSLKKWLTQLESLLKGGSTYGDLKDSFPLLIKAVDFLSDATAESVRIAAKASGLAVVARRSLWLKSWSDEVSSKLKLCTLPFHGNLLFGEDLESILEKASDSKKTFPRDSGKRKFPFRRVKKGTPFQAKKTNRDSGWSRGRNQKSRGYLFSSKNTEPSKQ